MPVCVLEVRCSSPKYTRRSPIVQNMMSGGLLGQAGVGNLGMVGEKDEGRSWDKRPYAPCFCGHRDCVYLGSHRLYYPKYIYDLVGLIHYTPITQSEMSYSRVFEE